MLGGPPRSITTTAYGEEHCISSAYKEVITPHDWLFKCMIITKENTRGTAHATSREYAAIRETHSLFHSAGELPRRVRRHVSRQHAGGFWRCIVIEVIRLVAMSTCWLSVSSVWR